MKGYCMSCGAMREMIPGKRKLLNGAVMVKGKCKKCKGGMSAIKKAK